MIRYPSGLAFGLWPHPAGAAWDLVDLGRFTSAAEVQCLLRERAAGGWMVATLGSDSLTPVTSIVKGVFAASMPLTGDLDGDGILEILIQDRADNDIEVWQAKSGWFVHAGGNYSPGTQGRIVAGNDIEHSPWGLDLRVGFHPGVTPPRQRVRRIRETTTITNTVTVTQPAPPAPAPNRPPTARIQCDPSVLEPGQTAKCGAQATDPEGGPLTYRWTATAGNVSPNDAPNVPETFTAPGRT